LELN